MKVFYEIDGFMKSSEQDDYNKGCVQGTCQISDYDICLQANSLKELIEKIKEEFYVDNDNILLNSCDEIGRIDIQFMEDENSTQPSDFQIEEWKAGKLKLYSVIYTGTVNKINSEIVDLNKEI